MDDAGSHLATVGERAQAASKAAVIAPTGASKRGSAVSIVTWIFAILLGVAVFVGILRLDRRWSNE